MWQPIDDVLHEMEAIHLVQYDHVERRGGSAFLLVAAHMNVLVVRAAIREAMDEPWITVESEHDGFVLREKSVEVVVAQAMRMLG